MTADIKQQFDSSPEAVLRQIALLREDSTKGDETLALINRAINTAHDYVITLLNERFLEYQHRVMDLIAKPEEEKTDSIMRSSLETMREAALDMQEYAAENSLTRWESRVYRNLGRVADYSGNYAEAIEYYSQAIDTAGEDPEVKEKGVPRQLELQAFMYFSTIKSGKVKEGTDKSRKLYEAFEISPEGKKLREMDYATWAIWRTGIVYRTVNALLDAQSSALRMDEMKMWVMDSEKLLYPPPDVKVWVDFSYRKTEFENTKMRLGI